MSRIALKAINKSPVEESDRIFLKVNRPVLTESMDQVPVGNKKSVAILMEGDSSPREFINEVKLGEEYPASSFPGEVLILTEKWAKSFAKAVNEMPAPLYLRGHEDFMRFKDRAMASGYVVGAKVENGSLFLRNYFRKPQTTEQEADIAQAVSELKAGLLSTSTGDKIRFSREYDEEKKMYKLTALESVGAQSNALVESNQTGSAAFVTMTSFKNENKVQYENKIKIKEGSVMEPKEIFIALKNALAAGAVSLADAVKELGVEIITEVQKQNLKKLEAAEIKLGPVDEFVKKWEADREANFSALKDSALKEKFTNELVRQAATDFFALKSGGKSEIDAEITRISQLKSIQAIAGSVASAGNYRIGGGLEPGREAQSSTIVA